MQVVGQNLKISQFKLSAVLLIVIEWLLNALFLDEQGWTRSNPEDLNLFLAFRSRDVDA